MSYLFICSKKDIMNNNNSACRKRGSYRKANINLWKALQSIKPKAKEKELEIHDKEQALH